MSSISPGMLKNWVPLKMEESLVEWLYTGDKTFTEPFFNDTILACRNFEENFKPYKVVSIADMMNEWCGEINSLDPSAIIFHVSRCGSTLLSQLLSLDEKHIVLSEVPFFDELLRLPYKKDTIDIKIADNYLRAAIKFYAQKRSGKETHLFIKTDSWHLHFYKRLRNLFPSVPFILLYRNPAEVILSHQKQRGMQSVPGLIEPAIFGFSKRCLEETNLDLYIANVLETYFEKMVEISILDPLILLINYEEGINSMMKKICHCTGIDLTAKTKKQFEERIRFDAKHSQQLFTKDHRNHNLPDFLLPVIELYKNLDEMSSNKHSIA